MSGARANGISAVILAAGEGRRMKSALPKVLHPVGGVPMVLHVVRAARANGVARPIVVVGHGREEVMKALEGHDLDFVVQEEQLGTGHAVGMAESYLRERGGEVLILCGDVPLVRAASLARFLEEHRAARRVATVMTAELEEPGSLGRILRGPDGRLRSIVEVRDATPEERALREINSGIYCFRTEELLASLRLLDRQNAQKQFYLTDTMAILRQQGKPVGAWRVPDGREVLGVNTPEELAQAERVHREWMNAGPAAGERRDGAVA
jgi:bifunctional UDP-N-acetylglucosamine pyrophosphorylase/glucosamine-1-phosphate N-acetyltransferase